MLQWMNEHAGALQVMFAALSALVWLVYLQIFVVGFLRQRRAEILINVGAGVGLDSRCFIANLGLEPIYVLQLTMSVETPEGTYLSAITDREALSDEQLSDPGQATNQGPVRSGDSYDAGSFGTMAKMALHAAGVSEDLRVDGVELTVVATHAASASLVAARRNYDVVERNGNRRLLPRQLEAQQIRGFFARRRLRRALRASMNESGV